MHLEGENIPCSCRCILTDPTMHVNTIEGAMVLQSKDGVIILPSVAISNHEVVRRYSYTLQSGTGRMAGSPRFVLFGRARDAGNIVTPTLENVAVGSQNLRIGWPRLRLIDHREHKNLRLRGPNISYG